ncbi:hypothetical protein PPL_01073 [Heterostelium album PN500]|uniref:peptidylprolyl isomerase n=1 Tax=Heterostelium pallidum (strain ATCC 26659 / Pp 5 / PN500) TaxID=670386 RepID=D3AY15_HETP5|nr:hypothetical protein PPL_01073 [Heterostelium album PN500]EFA85842.1 hypothetical protein PPL_01073 [Heterostelium album PN500]|eukprot:XP_020437948.1 hypothetical protein PPL_01073 [Heterostelium album PN500]
MGLDIKVIKEGNGVKPVKGNVVAVQYKGSLTNGYVFDQSFHPFKFKLGVGEVIDGWDLGILKMSVGEKAILTMTGDLAYGEEGSEPDIPPNSTLIFEVELLSFN